MIESENDTSKEDWGHSLEQKRANDIRRERREKGPSDLEFWRTSEVEWIWTGSLGR